MSDYLPSYMHLPNGVEVFSARDNIYRLFSSAAKGDFRELAEVLPHFKPSLQGHTLEERLGKWKLLFDDNFANISNLFSNVSSPVKHWLHTGHILYQSPVSGLWRMDHYWLESHVCTDILQENSEGKYLGKGDILYKWRKFDRLVRFTLDGQGCEDHLSNNKAYTDLWLCTVSSESESMPPYPLLPA